MADLEIGKFQQEVGQWHRHNFPAATTVEVALKAAEEVGELAEACGKLFVGIGNTNKLKAQEADAIGDIVVVLAAYCEKAGIDMEQTVLATWSIVRKRDWQANALTGGKERESVKPHGGGE